MTQTEEPLVDAHQHFWDLSLGKHPWLCESLAIPFRYGNYARLRETYLPADYLRDSAAFNVVKSVYVDAEWDPDDPLGETRWVHELRAQHGYPNAMVAQAWLDRDDVHDVLAGQAEFGFVRGIRNKPSAAHAPYAPARAPRGSMSDERWRRGYALLERFGLSFDLQVAFWHLPEAALLARDFPGIQIIVNHTGLPYERSEAGLSAWREALQTVAAHDNVALKISGLGPSGATWSVDHQRTVVLDAIRIFGVERCMFASNFPVDGLVTDFTTIMGGFQAIVADFPAAERRKLFHDNAVKFYRLEN
jgi:predicted TIM-barrel fold metal-dependent hydrolase